MGPEGRAGVRRAKGVAIVVAVSIALGGCVLIRAKRDQKQIAGLGRLEGTVRTEQESDKPLVVLLFTEASMQAGSVDELEVVDHFVRVRPGSYAFAVTPGVYRVLAFEDANADGNYDPDEPLLNSRAEGSRVELAPGETVERNLVIPTEGRAVGGVTGPVDIAALQARTMSDQVARSIGALLVRGELAELSDEKFGSKSGRMGLWEPLNFVIRVGAGIYLTEPYDPDRVPVLFVHGISGYPQEFTDLIEGLDRRRFQAWFYFYPSGVRLDNLGRSGAEQMLQLQLRHGFRDFVVVAHSMGGLVSRALIFHHAADSEREDIPLLVTLSTPWGGDTRAISGVERSPVVIGSWRDMAANSEFLKDLFWEPDDPEVPRALPERVAWHMMFSYRGKSRGDQSTDGSVTLKSQLRLEAWEQAVTAFPLDYSHTGILRSPEARQHLNELLGETFD